MSGPSSLLIVVNGYANKYEDIKNLNITPNEVVQRLERYGIGYVFIALA